MSGAEDNKSSHAEVFCSSDDDKFFYCFKDIYISASVNTVSTFLTSLLKSEIGT